MDWAIILLGTYISGIVIAIQGIVKLIMKRIPGAREGSADLIAGLVVAGITLALMFYLVGSAILRQ